MGEQGSLPAVTNSPSSCKYPETPAMSLDMQTVRDAKTVDSAADIFIPRGKQNQTFGKAKEMTFDQY